MIAAWIILIAGQSPDIVALERNALAELPLTRQGKSASLLGTNSFVTFTFEQKWARMTSEANYLRVVRSEAGFLDIWAISANHPKHLATMRVDGVVPGWATFPVKFYRPLEKAGAVFVADLPSGDSPRLELVRVTPEKPFFQVIHRGRATFDSATAERWAVKIAFRELLLNLKQFDDIKKRYIVKKHFHTVRFK